MGRKRKQKVITLDAESLRAVVTTDGRILYKDPATNELIPTCEGSDFIEKPEKLIQLLDVGDWLNDDGGPQFIITKKLLEKFLFFKMSSTYADIEGKQISEDRERLISDFRTTKITLYEPEDMYYISEYCLKERSATDRMEKFFSKMDNFDRAGAAVRLVATSIAAMRKSSIEEFALGGEILKLAYCTPKLKGKHEEHVMETLGLKNGRYFALKKSAIGNLSRMIFGPTRNERGFVDLENVESMDEIKELFRNANRFAEALDRYAAAKKETEDDLYMAE